MEKLFIPVVLGTAREGRRSGHVAHYVLEKLTESGFETTLVDVRDFDLSVTARVAKEGNPAAEPWQRIMERADGLLIVSPEYNHGFPGELKLLLDSLYKEYNRKPVALCAVSDGGFGGARMVEMFWSLAVNFGMVPVRTAVYFSNVQDIFAEDGTAQPGATPDVRLAKQLGELSWYAKVLKAGRASS